MESIILLVVLLFLILLGAPIGFILILIPFVYILFTDAVPLVLIPSQMFNAIDSVPLTAIAFFMLTGELMTSATITDRLVALSRALIGRIRGGLAQVNVLVSMFFAGMNGSVVADTAKIKIIGESVRLRSQLSRSPIAPREVSNQLKGPDAAMIIKTIAELRKARRNAPVHSFHFIVR